MATKSKGTRLFCVLTTPRSGSTWFMDMLASHPDIFTVGECFLNRPRREEWYNKNFVDLPRCFQYADRRGLRRPLSTIRYMNFLEGFAEKEGVMGFKLMYGHLLARPEILPRMLFKRYNIIHLIRNNHLHVLLSEWTMNHAGIIHSQKKVNPPKMYLNPETIIRNIKWKQRNTDAFRSLFKALPIESLEVTYESLCQETVKTVNRVVKFLSLPQAPSYESSFRKINRTSDKERILNYGEIEEALANTEFEEMLKK